MEVMCILLFIANEHSNYVRVKQVLTDWLGDLITIERFLFLQKNAF